MKLSAKWVVTIFLTIFSIYLVFVLNEEGPLRILFNLLTFAGIYGLAAIGLNVHFGLTGLLNFSNFKSFYASFLLMTNLFNPPLSVENHKIEWFSSMMFSEIEKILLDVKPFSFLDKVNDSNVL